MFVFQRDTSEKDKLVNYWRRRAWGGTYNNKVLVLYILCKSLLTPAKTSFFFF